MRLFFTEFTVDVWQKSTTLNSDGRPNAATYTKAFSSVPCRIVPMSAEEKFAAGVLDFAKVTARIYFDLTSIGKLTHDDIVVDTSDGAGNEQFYKIDEEVQKHRVFLPHWESRISNLGKAPQEVEEAY